MGAVVTSSDRYRHVVFATPAPRPPLNLGPKHSARSFRPAQPRPHTAEASPATADADDECFLAWLFAEAGLGARHYRPNALRRRLPACLRALRAENLAQARRMLRRQPALIPLALDALLLGVTEFFRDAPVYACLERELTSLLARTTGVLRVWSAGCSDGAELYSVAMLLAEQDALHRCELLGTDCRPEAIARAANGTFADAAMRGVSPERSARFFEDAPAAQGRRVRPELRERITWRRADVLAAAPPGPWHLILCRNLAMYLAPDAAGRLWRSLASALCPGGLLVTGKAERPVSPVGHLPIGPCIYRRYGGEP